MLLFCKENKILKIPFLEKSFPTKLNNEADLLINFCSIMKVKTENKRIITIHDRK